MADPNLIPSPSISTHILKPNMSHSFVFLSFLSESAFTIFPAR